MYKQSLLNIGQLSRRDIEDLMRLSALLKKAKKEGTEQQYLKGKNIAIIFEKDSTRTRCAFEVAAFDQGANVTYLGPSGSQISKKESIRDTARFLGRIYDGIEYRGYGQDAIEELAGCSGVPVWNGLTDESHPIQFLADLLTIREHTEKPLDKVKVCFAGKADNNVAMSLMAGCAKMGIEYSAAAPPQYFPDGDAVERLKSDGARITITESVGKAVRGVDFIYTDVWLSMGESENIWAKRIDRLSPYRVTSEVMAMSGNPECKFMHCLPAFHDLETKTARDIHELFGLTEMEVTDEVFESTASVVFDQAENRMHTTKAVMVASLVQPKFY